MVEALKGKFKQFYVIRPPPVYRAASDFGERSLTAANHKIPEILNNVAFENGVKIIDVFLEHLSASVMNSANGVLQIKA